MDHGALDDEIDWTIPFPLPFRVLVLIGLGLLGWATNLHGLEAAGLDPISTLDLRIEQAPHISIRVFGISFTPPSPLYGPLYRLSATYFSCVLATWVIFRYATGGDPLLVDVFGYIPGAFALILTFILVCPFNIFQRTERDKFLLAIRRCVASSMDSPVYFSDVVFADVFTSFAKVLGDVWLSVLMVMPGHTLLQPPAQEGLMRWIVPTIMSVPYFVRFRQCIIEYTAPLNESRRPLYNALKYATSFPVIYLSAAQRLVQDELRNDYGKDVANVAWHGEHPLFRLWLLAAVVNSLYSFWWDVTNDWGMTLLQGPPKSTGPKSLPRRLILPSTPSHSRTPSLHDHSSRTPYGLRSTLLYPLPIYPLLIFFNFVLRMLWTIKLSSHLHYKSDGSILMFIFEVLELVRRWMWVFIRVEWETIKRAQEDVEGQTEAADYELVDIPEVLETEIKTRTLD
ncbi:EXS-domain-containing protein [Cylindrobasidium torrendii FP15055 ss-10]|uniref:EXS-domain-containing protein n=1 Tax=Cylindrobasidium torrendii FP15055 ss-10 TaxID=1314674 RepID=A0A0D7BW39_9AGAR|nr:EXS-domain-containing protein [Cylindrobasidium torrendii FP15055 ss-10]